MTTTILPLLFLIDESSKDYWALLIGGLVTGVPSATFIIFQWYTNRKKNTAEVKVHESQVDKTDADIEIEYNKLLAEMRLELRTNNQQHESDRERWNKERLEYEARQEERFIKVSSLQKILEEMREESMGVDILFEKMRRDLEKCKEDQETSKNCRECIERTLKLIDEIEPHFIGNPDYADLLNKIWEFRRQYKI